MGRCLVSKWAQPSKVDLGWKVDPRDSFVLKCKVAPRRLTHSGTGVLKGERWGASTGGQGVSQRRRAGGPKVSQHRWSLGTPGRRGQ